MASTIQCGRRTREDFGKIPSIVEIPNLIEIQKRSYEQFLQKDVAPERREETGLQAVFKSVFPIADYNDNALLEFDSYHFGDPKYTVEECHDRGMTFAIPLKVTLRLVVYDHDKEAKTRTIREQRGQEGRAAPHDGERHLHHQRHRARGGVAAPALGRGVLRRR